MRRKLFPLIGVCLFLTFSASAQTLNEGATVFEINGRTANIILAIENDSRSRTVSVRTQLLDPDGKIRGAVSQEVMLQPGFQLVEMAMDIGDLAGTEAESLPWFRLQYTIGETAGIVSIANIFHNYFGIRGIGASTIIADSIYRVRIDTTNSFTRKGIAAVEVVAVLKAPLQPDGETMYSVRGSGITDADGSVFIELPITATVDLADERADLSITATRNGLVQTVAETLSTRPESEAFILMTDKPIYQPGQEVHIRGIVLKVADKKRVVAGGGVEVRIEDEDDTVLFRKELTASEFGIAAADWEIPANAKLGTYSIAVKNALGEHLTEKRIKVSRYDLPNFTVTAKPDRTYYLPEHKTAKISVNADYLFGRSVTEGTVRVVEESDREWNYKEQKYEIEEGFVSEGETDENGIYTVEFDLTETLENIRPDEDDDEDEVDHGYYRDVHFAAYFTDAATNRTEQKRFDVRVTRMPIHIYFWTGRYDEHSDLPLTGFVSTFYADGTPAECDIDVAISEEDKGKFEQLSKLRTNKYGLARLQFSRPNYEDDIAGVDLRLIASDPNGAPGLFFKDINFEEDEGVRMVANKTIYRPGEDIRLSIVSTQLDNELIIEAARGDDVLLMRSLRTANGKAEISLPYDSRFQGEMRVSVYDPLDTIVNASVGVIYPAPRDLRVSASFDKAIYKPGEDAHLTFSVLDPGGRPAESALGVAIFDRAVEVRAATDESFGMMSSELYGWLGYGGGHGSVSIKDLNEIDPANPIPDDLQLVAEKILAPNFYFRRRVFETADLERSTMRAFGAYFKGQFEPIREALKNAYASPRYEIARDDASLRRILGAAGIDFAKMRDPWGEPYAAEFELVANTDRIRIVSKGMDKTAGTDDDLNPYVDNFEYFKPMGLAIDTIIRNHHKRTGGYIRDRETLFFELGIGELNDRFGRPYMLVFGVSRTDLTLNVKSMGEDGKSDPDRYNPDDFTVWRSTIDYAGPIGTAVRKVIAASAQKPESIEEFEALLAAGGMPVTDIKDAFGRAVYVTMRRTSQYADRVTIVNEQKFGDEKPVQKTIIKPITQELIIFELRSAGADGKAGSYEQRTYDDFSVSSHIFVLSERSRDDVPHTPAVRIQPSGYITKNGGAIAGAILDPNGSVIPNAEISASLEGSANERTTTTDANGMFFVGGLQPGTYQLSAIAPGFKSTRMVGVEVTAGRTVNVNITLEVGHVDMVVAVAASSVELAESTSATIGTTVETGPNRRLTQDLPQSAMPEPLTQTPRLREYFPETLLWVPELITDADGNSTARFKFADNITTWKMVALASDKNGNVGLAESEITAFQSFFADLDPPKFLTAGDEIFLPVQIRNYTGSKQNVDVTMADGDWFSFRGSSKKQIAVENGKAENAVFGFAAERITNEGKQRVTAIAAADSDAIEKSVAVRPDGREVMHTESKFFDGSEQFRIDVPADAIAGTPTAEIKLYPNLFSHVAESVEGLLQRPYGCGEQTISSTYPNLMILRTSRSETALTAKARRYLNEGYQRILGYQRADGGFTYWGPRDEADASLTAYAVRFLNDAKDFLAVDNSVTEKAESWLRANQRADGSWTKKYSWERAENTVRTKMMTSYIARTLASVGKEREKPAAEVIKALEYLRSRNSEIDEPYALALYGLASLDAGDPDEASRIAAMLSEMSYAESDGVYWNLETNTPFYGWGTPGRIETTAVVTQLLMRVPNADPYSDLSSKGIIFMLRQKDRYGVWHSTQTTINVLDTLIDAMGKSHPRDRTIRILANGKEVKIIAVTTDQIEQMSVDLSNELITGQNIISVESDSDATLMAQVVAGHFTQWLGTDGSGVNLLGSRAIALDYSCDTTEASIMQPITCSVSIERVGFRGYGMLLAEIGTPPGADVDRESLEKAIEETRAINAYEVLPDRIVVYMFAKPGGSKFSFKFRPRYGIDAKTPPSIAYDYYNPEAAALLQPLSFRVK